MTKIEIITVGAIIFAWFMGFCSGYFIKKPESKETKENTEGLKKLLRIANCPEILIENPRLIKSAKPTEKDIEWAMDAIKRYKEANDT